LYIVLLNKREAFHGLYLLRLNQVVDALHKGHKIASCRIPISKYASFHDGELVSRPNMTENNDTPNNSHL
jgi:hypothetical protein